MNVFVSSLAQAFVLFGNTDCVISIVDQDTIVPDFSSDPNHGRYHHLIVRADDTDDPNDKFAPTLQDTKTIFAFAQLGQNVLIHCVAGISRSVAYGIGLMHASGVSVFNAVQCVHMQRGFINPNQLILKHIDTYLNKSGMFYKEVMEVFNILPKEEFWQ